ncbi:hypothetical protein POVCU2_0022420 [Plasmodium ovale curtisi]|uniref:Uncharacterized protein n=1 Tax=Plasmodium ovale curtisi TaxID=864141 RepID=A0A1A8WJ50_PLAOA|nr:hypothetical protein POVCU2_0022420 [Plasmodium ovale curtisi]SBS91280.1 hypothetical protein POVCU1_020350 [Plasmodium ovale curtisi]
MYLECCEENLSQIPSHVHFCPKLTLAKLKPAYCKEQKMGEKNYQAAKGSRENTTETRGKEFSLPFLFRVVLYVWTFFNTNNEAHIRLGREHPMRGRGGGGMRSSFFTISRNIFFCPIQHLFPFKHMQKIAFFLSSKWLTGFMNRTNTPHEKHAHHGTT